MIYSILLLATFFMVCMSKQMPELWIGTAPFCGGSRFHCDLFDMDYLTWNRLGRGNRCWTGKKVACRMRGKAAPLSTDRHKLTVMTYAIQNLPHMYKHVGQRERTCHIPRAIATFLPEVDVIAFQEFYTDGCWHNLTMRDMLHHLGFTYQTDTIGEPPTLPRVINGGVFIASRWPLTDSNERLFEAQKSSHADRFAGKGFVYVKLRKLGRTHHVIGTELQSGDGREYDSIREAQAREIRDFIEQENISPSEGVFIAGDFYSDMLHKRGKLQRILTSMNLALPTITPGSLNATWSPSKNELVKGGFHDEWVDFVGYSMDHVVPTNITMKSVELQSDRKFEFCTGGPLQPFYVFPDTNTCSGTKKTNHLSDHFPVVAEILF